MEAFLRVAWSRILGFLRPREASREFDEEIRAHLDLAIEDKVRRGLAPREARRQAHLELGNLTGLREAAADARGLPWIGGFWLDLKLGSRMLRKSWTLTLVAGFAMTVVIALAAVAFEVLAVLEGEDLPLPEGDRIVALQILDRETGDGLGASPVDLLRWRESLHSVQQIGAFRNVERNLEIVDATDGEAPGEAVEVAEISPVAFELARVAPARGRPLVAADAARSAEPVLLIGDVAWRTRFRADPDVVGRRVRLDGTVHTIVGVMPRGFGFPVAHHYWIPLRVEPGATAPRRDGDLFVFARLADGLSVEKASAELGRLGPLAVGVSGATDEEERGLRVVRYGQAFLSDLGRGANLAIIVFVLLLIPPCANVAILVYARTITRQGEFAARFVLGASRFRIVLQVFLEQLVLSVGAGLLALAIARIAVHRLVADRMARGELPFWMDAGLSVRTFFVVGLLAFVAALVAGVIPALRATGRGIQSGLKSLGGQPLQARLGPVWTTLVVLQVAVATALLPTSAEMVWGTVRSGLLGPGFAAGSFLTAELDAGTLDAGTGSGENRFRQRQDALVRSLQSRSEIAAATVVAHVPGHEPWLRVEREELGADADPVENTSSRDAAEEGLAIGSSRVTRVNRVDTSFFDVVRVPLLAGRLFGPADFDPSRRSVIVNRTFALHVLGEDDPVGCRIRYRARDGETLPFPAGPDTWFEIVGVVADLHRNNASQAVFHPAGPEARPSVGIVMRVLTDPSRAAGVLRTITWATDPALRLGEIRTLDDIYREQAVGNWVGAGTLVAATLALLFLSAAGIGALMSFTVGRRRREIGIRAALGASPSRILRAVFGRALGQVCLGVLAGCGCATIVDRLIPIRELGGWELPGIVPAAVVFLAGVAFVSLLGPAHRGLRVDPAEELRVN